MQQRRRREQIAADEAAGIAHEHTSRREVVDQEPEGGAGGGSRDDGGGRVLGECAKAQTDPGNGNDATGEAIHVVDQVDGVHQPDDPQHRRQVRDRVDLDDLDTNSAEEQHRCDNGLTRQFRRRGERAEVVEQPQGERRDQADRDRRSYARDREECRHDDDRRERDCRSAKKRRCRTVPAIRPRRHDQPDPPGGGAEHGRRRGR